MSITYSEGVFVALVTQHAVRMRHVVLLSVAWLAVPYFSVLSHKRHDFRGNKILSIKCVFIFSKILKYSKKNKRGVINWRYI